MKNDQTEMTGNREVHPETSKPQTDGSEPVGRSLLDFFAVITRWRKFIVRTIVVSTLLAVAFALVSPKWYKGTASVFPAEKTDLFSGLEGVSSLVRNFAPSRGLSALTGPSETERYLAILHSESALLKVIDRFDLTRVYDITNYPREKTMKELLSNTEFQIGDEGKLSISVYDKDPQRAADLTNYFVQVLNEINSELHVLNARANREFIEARYNKNLVDLRAAEDSLKAFQLKHGVVALPQQLEASIKAMAEISAMLVVKEVQLDVLRKSVEESHPGLANAKLEVAVLRDKISELNRGSGETKGEMNVLVPLNMAPSLGVGYVRLYRDVEIQNKILQFVTPLFEQAKVEENRSTPSVIVLDSALVPERKAKPKASLYGLLAMVVSAIIALGFVFSAEAIQRLRAMNPERTDALWSAARSDWFGLWTSRKRKQ
jgi:tyrosine-protein kinase Etk/Wzc